MKAAEWHAGEMWTRVGLYIHWARERISAVRSIGDPRVTICNSFYALRGMSPNWRAEPAPTFYCLVFEIILSSLHVSVRPYLHVT